MNIPTDRNPSHRLNIAAAWALSGCLLGGIAVASAPSLYVIALIPLLLYVCLFDQRWALFAYLIALPFSRFIFMRDNLFSMMGMKPSNIVAAFLAVCVCAYYLIYNKTMHAACSRRVIVVMSCYFLIFARAVIKTVPYLYDLADVLAKVHENAFRFVLSVLVKPSFYLVSVLAVCWMATSRKRLNRIVDVYSISFLFLSLAVLYIAYEHRMLLHDRQLLNDQWRTYFGLHYNAIAGFYICGIALVFHNAVTKKGVYLLVFVVSLMAVAVLQSRTGYAALLFSILLYLLATGRLKMFLYSIFFIMAGAIAALQSFMATTLRHGIDEGNINIISSNRIEGIWKPLLSDRIGSLSDLLFGASKYSAVLTDSFIAREMLQTAAPHNAALEMLLDSGLVVLGVFIIAAVFYLRKIWQTARIDRDNQLWAFFVCFCSYLLGTVSGHSFYPSIDTAYLFPVIGMTLAYMNLRETERPKRAQ